MRQSEKNRNVQVTETAQEKLHKKFSKATQELQQNFGYEDSKKSIDLLLLGYISYEYLDSIKSVERANTLDFFNKLLIHLKLTEKDNSSNPENLISIEHYAFFDAFKFRKVNKYFIQTSILFLSSHFADELDLRSNLVLNISELRKYVKNIYSIKKSFNSKN